MPRLIVRMHAHLTDPPVYWRSGVFLEIDGNRAFVRGDTQEGRVYIAVCDAPAGRRRALAVVRSAFRAIHATIPGLHGAEMVPLPRDRDIDPVSYDHLVRMEAAGRQSFWPEGALGDYTIRELLDGIELPKERAERQKGITVEGDYYEIHGQGIGVGPSSVVKGNSIEQRYENATRNLDLSTLADELARLREELSQTATLPEQYRALGDVLEAENASRAGGGGRALELLARLQWVDAWAIDVAARIDAPVAKTALQTALGL